MYQTEEYSFEPFWFCHWSNQQLKDKHFDCFLLITYCPTLTCSFFIVYSLSQGGNPSLRQRENKQYKLPKE